MNEIYNQGVQALAGLKHRAMVEEGLKKSQEVIDDFYETAEKLGYYCFHTTTSKAGYFYIENPNKKWKSKKYDNEIECVTDLILILTSTPLE